MQKMSILMSVPVAVWVFGEEAGIYKVIGFILALGAIVMVNLPAQIGEKNRQEVKSTGLWWIPLVTWILAGVIEVVFLKVQHEQLADINDPSFIIIVFGTAGVLGLILAAWGWINGKLIFEWKNVLGGIILGVPNYGSMLFMLWALAKGLGGSIVFPVNNVGIIVVTAIGAVLIFQERLTKWNWLGVGLAATAIYLMAI
ncbi:MAG: EamA family transporter [Saprospiraceae bacterium]|nr:EamA family transporter [Saprospiraceae bacterium]